MKTAAAASIAAVGLPYIKTAWSAGRVTLGLWDHWIPGANDVSRAVIEEWGKKNNTEVVVDYITSIGFKGLLTGAAEARARVGHDIYDFPTVQTSIHRDSLEPMNDVVDELGRRYGKVEPIAEYLGKFDGTWFSAPGPIGLHSYPMVSRVDYFKKYAGVDLKAIFPNSPNRDAAMVDSWNYDTFLVACQKLHKAGFPFGNPIGPTSDSQDWLGPLFRSFGSEMTDAEGNLTVNSDGTRTALEYMKKLTAVMPEEVYAWDDAGNNRWIISSRGCAIQNPPSAWAVAKRDKPEVAAQLWHHDTPKGPAGHYRGALPRMIGVWEFGKQKQASKDLLLHMWAEDSQNRIISAANGYDLPLYPHFNKHPVWTEIGPPSGGQYNYPIRGDEVTMMAGAPSPVDIAAQIYTQALIPNMVARVTQGNENIEEVIKWAEDELEGYKFA